MPHPTIPDTYNLTSAGFRKLKLFSAFLKPYFESYWIVLQCFKQIAQNSIKTKDFLKKIQVKGNRMYRNNEIELKEALSKINYKNAVDFFIAHGIKSAGDTEQIKFYTEKIKKCLNYLRS